MRPEATEILKRLLRPGVVFSCRTEHGGYYGVVVSVHDYFVVLTDGIVEFREIYWHSFEREVSNELKVKGGRKA
ncbi:hypothetical protein [Alteribacter aurantiacus]|uniref:hypothetical protein n=1 Tax=Alteribacter aurantiacus TaxID=254410 RepID=UPI0003FD8B2C|nr:hypothetical protein [Alteribacter aurantiacus]